MDFDYNTVKYLVIVLSLLILGYVIFIVYNDLTTVRGDFNKLKNKMNETSDSLNELHKKIDNDIEYSLNCSVGSFITDKDATLDDILNNNLFSDSVESASVTNKDLTDEKSELKDSSNYSSFSLNIPFFNRDSENQNKICEIPEVPEIEKVENEFLEPYIKETEDLKFVKTTNQCESTITSGKNKGKQCSKDSISDSNYCSKHYKKVIQN